MSSMQPRQMVSDVHSLLAGLGTESQLNLHNFHDNSETCTFTITNIQAPLPFSTYHMYVYEHNPVVHWLV